MRRAVFTIFLLILILSSQSFAASSWRAHTYKVLHYRIALHFNINKGMVYGTTTLQIKPLRNQFRNLFLDAHDFELSNLLLNGQPVDTFTVSPNNINIRFGRAFNKDSVFQLSLTYSCRPERGLYFFHPDSSTPDQAVQIWSQGEGQDNHFWFPCYDYPNEKATMEMIVTVDSGLTAVSNGRLITRLNIGRQTIFYYRFDRPLPVYLISLIVGKYKRYVQFYKTVPLEYYVYPKYSRQDALRSFGRTPDMVEFFSRYSGFDYPYSKYTQTIISHFMYSGMENISATTLTDRTMHSRRAHLDFESEGLVAHELAHQWFGDLVTCRDWTDTWLNEGFATYFTDLYYEHWKGYDVFRYRVWRRDQLPTIKNNLNRPRPLSGKNAGDIYIKGASVLHMLRIKMGDGLFREGIKNYLQRHAFANAESSDLRQALENSSGMNLHEFFRQWVYGKGIPEFLLSKSYSAKTGTFTLHIQQVQDSVKIRPVFTMNLKIGLSVNGRYKEYAVLINRRKQEFNIKLPQAPQMVIFDAGQDHLKTLTFKQSAREWLYQLQNAPQWIDRIQALQQLRNIRNPQSIEKITAVLLDIIKSRQFYGLRLEAVRSLKRLPIVNEPKKNHIIRVLIKVLQKEKRADMRRSLLAAFEKFPDNRTLSVLREHFKNDPGYGAQTAALNSLIKLDSLHAFEYIKNALQTDSFQQQLRAAALRNAKVLADSAALNIAAGYLAAAQPPRLRLEAVRLLGTLAKKGNKSAKRLLLQTIKTGSEDNRWRPLSAAISALNKMNEKRLLPIVQKICSRHGNRYLKQQARAALKHLQNIAK